MSQLLTLNYKALECCQQAGIPDDQIVKWDMVSEVAGVLIRSQSFKAVFSA